MVQPIEPQLLDQLITRIQGLAPEAQKEFAEQINGVTKGMKFIPNPGPQTDAWNSDADVLLYGGEAGGGKSGLVLGLALEKHQRSLIMRRKYTDLSALTDDVITLNGSRDGFNGSSPPTLRTQDGRVIEFGAAQHDGDEQSWMGRPHDFIGIDEVWQFSRKQVRFLMTWLRSTVPGQRCRVVLATNPPLSADGDWLIEMFAPWLDPQFPKPAPTGELRWVVTNDEGRDIWVKGPELIEIDGRPVKPLSRTFIRAKLKDNPFLAKTDYGAMLDSLDPVIRASMRDGNFMASRKDDDWQVIPSEWIRQSQKRWTPQPPADVPMCSIAVDCTGGGSDENVFAPRYDGYYPDLICVPGKETPLGDGISGLVIKHRRDNADIVIDMGGGYGNLPYKELTNNGLEPFAYKGAEGSTGRSNDGLYGFVNKRSETVWRFREALDPHQNGGSIIVLPNDTKLFADLTALRFSIVPYKGRSCVKVESKEDVVDRLGRSPDRGDAVLMAWVTGKTVANIQGGWTANSRNYGKLNINLGHRERKARRA